MTNNFTATIKPTLSVRNAAAAVEFYKSAFSAEVLMQVSSPDGDTVAELSIGGAGFMLPMNRRNMATLARKTWAASAYGWACW